MALGGVKGRRLTRKTKHGHRKKTITAPVVRNIIKSMSETKFHDTIVGNFSADNAGVVSEISDIAVGSGVTDREGNRVYVKSISLHIELISADATQYVRFMLVNDRRPDGTTNPVIGQILQDTGVNINISNLAWTRRFSYVLNKVVSFSDSGTRSYSAMFNIPINKTMGFGSSTTGDYAQNSLWFVVISDSAASAHPSCRITTRIKFKDL